MNSPSPPASPKRLGGFSQLACMVLAVLLVRLALKAKSPESLPRFAQILGSDLQAWPRRIVQPGPPEPSFGEVATREFAGWDLNHDRRLERSEIDQLMTEPSIRGASAAALASIKLHERSLHAAQRQEFFVRLGELCGQPEKELRRVGPGQWERMSITPFDYEPRYRQLCSELNATPSRLFAGKGPDFGHLHQGMTADCFFFSVAGGLAALHPNRIVSMIEPESHGSFLVHFPRTRPVRVSPLTQAEAFVNDSLATLDDGLWVVVLQKAVGEVLGQSTWADARPAEPTDALAHGGSSAKMVRLFTGHTTDDFDLRGTQFAAQTKNRIRTTLPQAFAAGRLVALSMDENPAGPQKVPGLGYDHAYAVLAFDPQTDVLTIWNPWGNAFTPDGPEGPEYGFSTTHGVFHVPLASVYDNFSHLHIESNRPVSDVKIQDGMVTRNAN